MNQFPPVRRRPAHLTHPNLGALLGLILIAILVPFTVEYGATGFILSLVVAGVAAGALARGGAGMGFGSGARAAAIFMLFLLTSWALVLFRDQGVSDLLSSQWLQPFAPYILAMATLWDVLTVAMDPYLGGLISMAGGDMFVDLILRIVVTSLAAGFAGALGGAVAGKPRPLPTPTPNPYDLSAYPQAGYGNPRLGDPGAAYLCPWCGLKVLPHMELCWNCGGPLQLPPPPAY